MNCVQLRGCVHPWLIYVKQQTDWAQTPCSRRTALYHVLWFQLIHRKATLPQEMGCTNQTGKLITVKLNWKSVPAWMMRGFLPFVLKQVFFNVKGVNGEQRTRQCNTMLPPAPASIASVFMETCLTGLRMILFCSLQTPTAKQNTLLEKSVEEIQLLPALTTF